MGWGRFGLSRYKKKTGMRFVRLCRAEPGDHRLQAAQAEHKRIPVFDYIFAAVSTTDQ